MGLTTGALTSGLFSALTLMVMVTTFLAPPLLKILFPPGPRADVPPDSDGMAQLATEA
jgi:Kef-type K+ transport system membrane component KefB